MFFIIVEYDPDPNYILFVINAFRSLLYGDILNIAVYPLVKFPIFNFIFFVLSNIEYTSNTLSDTGNDDPAPVGVIHASYGDVLLTRDNTYPATPIL